MAAKTKKLPTWKELHNTLNDAGKLKVRDTIMQACEWSIASFYRYKNNPAMLKFYEKKIVAEAYGKKVWMLFPETKAVKAA